MGGTDYAKPVTSLPDSALKERPFHQALDMIALERLGKPIPQKLFKSITDYVSARHRPDTNPVPLASSHAHSHRGLANPTHLSDDRHPTV